jgi:hypothetical protein
LFVVRRFEFGAFAARAVPLWVCLFAGIRALLACFKRCPCAGGIWFVCDGWLVFLGLCRHPRFAFALQALPLCGAAPTFLCRRKEK